MLSIITIPFQCMVWIKHQQQQNYDSQRMNKSYFGMFDNNQYFLSLKEK